MKADIFRIQKDYLPDQAGLYTVVFFNGCPLRCIWCSHPMPDSRPTEIDWNSKDCLYCHLCERNCPTGSLVFKDHVLTYNPDTCSFCRTCENNCPSRMFHFRDKLFTFAEARRRILAESSLYQKGGGIFLSGISTHEQAAFASDLFKTCREMGIRTFFETTGFIRQLDFDRVLRYSDHVMIDLKHYDDAKHVRYTGVSNVTILANLDTAVASGVDTAVRISVIPGINDSVFDAMSFGTLLKDHGVRKVYLCDFDTLSMEKFGDYFTLSNNPDYPAESVSDNTLLRYADQLTRFGISVHMPRVNAPYVERF